MSIELVMQSNHPIFCHPLLLLPSIFPSIRICLKEVALCIRWPKYWNFSFSVSPSNEYSGLIYFKIDWFDLLAVQGTLKSLLQHQNLKASILWCPAFVMVHSQVLALKLLLSQQQLPSHSSLLRLLIFLSLLLPPARENSLLLKGSCDEVSP